jgi:two-component system, chemotaxis family, protein-glutamate methylesterase/glutaminase
MGAPIRVLVVDDSRFIQRQLVQILEGNGSFKVVATVGDGEKAIAAVREHDPDVVTMDITMPHMDGLAAVAWIMAQCPKPVVIVSSYTRKGGKTSIYALELGAIDIVEKPNGNAVTLDLAEKAQELIEKVRMASRIRVVRNAAAPRLQPAPPSIVARPASPDPRRPAPRGVAGRSIPGRVIVVASSTGGPATLSEILPALPAELEVPILIAQHMPAGFTRDLADQLDRRCRIRVREAVPEELPRPGFAYIAPGDRHLEIGCGGEFHVHDGPKVKGLRPSADLLFASAAGRFGPGVLAAVLTGMGMDGAEGVRAIREHGGRAVAQDEETSVVYGMPEAAVRTGCIDRVVPVCSVAGEFIEWARRSGPCAVPVVPSTASIGN